MVRNMGLKEGLHIYGKLTVALALFTVWLFVSVSLLNRDSKTNGVRKIPSRRFRPSKTLPCPTLGPVDWHRFRPQDLSFSQVIDYIEWTNSSSCRLAHDFGGRVTRAVGVDGQKAICMDYDVRPESGNCLVYSFGVSHEWSFDKAMESYGCEVYAFDPSMNLTSHHHGPAIHFYDFGLNDQNEEWDDPLDKKWSMKTLETIYKTLKHRGRIIDYLKIDIEMSEWKAIPQILASGMMDRVRQLGIEIHLPRTGGGLDLFRSRVQVVKSLEDYGFIRFDSKNNPFSVYWNKDVDYEEANAYELAWYNSKLRRIKPKFPPILVLRNKTASVS